MIKESVLTHTKCPVCKLSTSMGNLIEEPNGNSAIWYKCNCGVTFQENVPEQKGIVDTEVTIYKSVHGMHTYLSIIEEITYGRKFLPTGDEHLEKYLENRGWVKLLEETDTPDLIICEGVLEEQLDPIEFFQCAYETLPANGVLYIDTPDTDYLARTNIVYFGHWKSNENYILWNSRSLVRELERVGFDVILTRRNATTRYRKPDTVQVIAQK